MNLRNKLLIQFIIYFFNLFKEFSIKLETKNLK
jgi:hypothetical protein